MWWRKATALLVIATAAFTALAAGSAPAGADPLADKQAQATRLETQVNALDQQVADLSEQYRSEVDQLDTIKGNLARARTELSIAQRERDAAREQLEQRLVTLYKSGSSDYGLLTAIANSGSVSEMLDRADGAKRISAQDARILDSVKRAERRIAQRKARLSLLQASHAQTVRRARAKRDKVASLMRQRRAALASVNADVRRILEQRRAAAAAAAAAQSRAMARQAATTATPTPSAAPDLGTAFSGGAPAPAAGPKGAAAVAVAMQYLGVPYVWGGSSPSGFDCSGLTQYSYAQVGISLPRTTYTQWNAGVHVSRDELQPGDLVFFSNLGHMGMYIGGGNMIHAPHTGDVVRIASLNDSYWQSEYMGAVRVA